MTTRNSFEPKTIIVSFHVGRGGYHHNPGYKTYNPYVHSIQDLFEYGFLNCEDEDGNPLPDDEWTLTDQGGNIILEGRKEIESPVGVLEWDTIYNTDIVRYIEDCTEEEIGLILEANHEGKIEDEELADLIHTSLVNHKPINTMEELADYWNSCNECPFDLPDVIEKNGWHEPDDISELEWTICFDDEGNRVELNEKGNAEVIYA